MYLALEIPFFFITGTPGVSQEYTLYEAITGQWTHTYTIVHTWGQVILNLKMVLTHGWQYMISDFRIPDGQINMAAHCMNSKQGSTSYI